MQVCEDAFCFEPAQEIGGEDWLAVAEAIVTVTGEKAKMTKVRLGWKRLEKASLAASISNSPETLQTL